MGPCVAIEETESYRSRRKNSVSKKLQQARESAGNAKRYQRWYCVESGRGVCADGKIVRKDEQEEGEKREGGEEGDPGSADHLVRHASIIM